MWYDTCIILNNILGQFLDRSVFFTTDTFHGYYSLTAPLYFLLCVCHVTITGPPQGRIWIQGHAKISEQRSQITAQGNCKVVLTYLHLSGICVNSYFCVRALELVHLISPSASNSRNVFVSYSVCLLSYINSDLRLTFIVQTKYYGLYLMHGAPWHVGLKMTSSGALMADYYF